MSPLVLVRIRRSLTLLGVLAATLAAGAPAAYAANFGVSLTSGDRFSPATVSVQPGDSVTWTWASNDDHNITANSGQADTWASGNKSSGTWARTFNIVGRFTYRCTLHSGMNGVVVVAQPPPAPDTTAPAAPAATAATAADGRVTIDWADSTAPDLANYVVSRQTAGAGSWTVVASPTESRHVDTTVANGTSYSYRVTAVDTTGNVSTAGSVVTALPVAPPPPPPPAPGAGPLTRHVAIADFVYSPATITVNSGDTVAWDWIGPDLNHSVTSLAGVLETFDSHLGQLLSAIVGAPAGGYSRTFSQTGDFGYFCRLHPDMTGMVKVVGSGAPAEQPADPAPAANPAPPPPAPPAATPAREAKHWDVKIADFAFTPAKLSIALGDDVTWRWTGADVDHSVTSKEGSAETFESHPGVKISGIKGAPAGGSYTHVFSKEGTFAYFCRTHPGMTGEVTVGPKPLRVRIASVKRKSATLRVSYRLTKPAQVKAQVYRAGKRIASKTVKGKSGTNAVRITLPRSARRATLRVVLRGDGTEARATVRAARS